MARLANAIVIQRGHFNNLLKLWLSLRHDEIRVVDVDVAGYKILGSFV